MSKWGYVFSDTKPKNCNECDAGQTEIVSGCVRNWCGINHVPLSYDVNNNEWHCKNCPLIEIGD